MGAFPVLTVLLKKGKKDKETLGTVGLLRVPKGFTGKIETIRKSGG